MEAGRRKRLRQIISAQFRWVCLVCLMDERTWTLEANINVKDPGSEEFGKVGKRITLKEKT